MANLSVTPEASRVLETLIRGLEVLDCVESAVDSAMTLTEIAERVGLYKSRVIRICGTLISMGYLVHDRNRKLYRLGPRVLSLGTAYARSNPIVLTVRPELETMYSDLKITASFYVLRNMRRVCVAREGPERTWQNTMEGEERELHYGSTGKIFLAFGERELRERFFSQEEPYTKLTPYTMTTARQVWDEVEKVRETGYAESFEERVIGLAGLAAPVFQFDGELVGALSVAGDRKYFTPKTIPGQVDRLLRGADNLSRKFGFDPEKRTPGPKRRNAIRPKTKKIA